LESTAGRAGPRRAGDRHDPTEQVSGAVLVPWDNSLDDRRAEVPPSQFEQSFAFAYCDWTKLIRGSLMKVLGAVVVVLIALYFADQEFAQGKFTDTVRQVGAQIMHSLGI
jgi:hypothetical protein